MEKTVYQSKEELPPEVIVENVGISEGIKQQASPPVKRPRPANGFLGFCHRHRPIVSRHNKKLENRQVTKILGSWWNSLTDEQRKVYEDRSREHKELFLKANPGYKWYTRPESTGNTPVTRQSMRRGRKLGTDIATSGGAITPGKLADESQMGNLSSLMQFSDQGKKRNVEMVNYIASEHDYLETKPYFLNNNSIMSVETPMGQCMTDGCGTSIDLMQNAQKEEEPSNEYNDEVSADTAEDDEEDKEDQNQKVSVPKNTVVQDDDNLKALPECPSFKEFMKVCPTYSYEDFLEKKAETNTAHKVKLMKRRKWAQALMEYGPDSTSFLPEEVPPPRRRRKRRACLTPRAQKRSSPTTDAQSSQIAVGEVVQQATLMYVPSIPLNHLHLLVTAAETLEHCLL